MQNWLLRGVLFCLAAQASAQVGVKGKVLDAETLKPIENVNVRYYETNFSLSSTDSTGSFTIENRDIGLAVQFKHLLYRPYTVKASDSIPGKVFLHRCCESRAEAQEMFKEYCLRQLRYPAKLRRMEIGGEVLIRFSMDNALNIYDVKILKDIEGYYAESAQKLMATLPIEVRNMLSYFNTTEFLLPLVFSYNKAAPPYTPPVSTDATVLEPLIAVIYGTRAVH